MNKFFTFFCVQVGVIGSLLVNALGGWDTAIQTMIICMVVDYVTGVFVAGVFKRSKKTENGALDSSICFKGICKKMVMIFSVFIAYRLDLLMGVDWVRYTVIIGFICNEIISFIENVGLMGLPLPKGIIRAIEVLKEKEGD